MMWNGGFLCSHCRGIGRHLELICDTLSYFTFLQSHQCTSRLVRVFLGTLWSSVKHIKAPYVFDWEHGLLCTQCRESGLISQQGGSLMVFFELRREPGVHYRVTAGMAIENSSFISDIWTPH